jgi:hypothetical protein
MAPDEHALAFLHHWWCYDLEKLQQVGSRPKPRISLSIGLNQRGTLIVSWRPTSPHGDSLKESDFRICPYFIHSNEDRLIEVREFRFVMPFHRRHNESVWAASIYQKYADVSENRIVSNALLLQAAAQLVSELKKRLSYCFSVTMIEDIFVEWEDRPSNVLIGTLKTWEIQNVAERERKLATKLLTNLSKPTAVPSQCSSTWYSGLSRNVQPGPPQLHTPRLIGVLNASSLLEARNSREVSSNATLDC